MDASVPNRMRVKRSARTSQPVCCTLCRATSVTLQYRAFDCPRHPRVRQLPDRGIPMRNLEDDDRLTEGHASACPGRAEARPSVIRTVWHDGRIFLTLCKRALSFNIDAVNFSLHGRDDPSTRNA